MNIATKIDYCDVCIEIPEMKRVQLIWHWSGPGQGMEYCPMCEHVYSIINCPYIPQSLTEKTNMHDVITAPSDGATKPK